MAATLKLKRSAVQAKIPATGDLALGELAINTYDGKLYLKRNNGSDSIVELGIAIPRTFVDWKPTTNGPVDGFEYDEHVLQFVQGASNASVAWIKVPPNYRAGFQIFLKLFGYSPSISNNVKFEVVTTLIRPGTDAVNSSTNQNTANTGDITLTSPVNKLFEASIALTSSVGQINSVIVNPGHMLKIQLTRVSPSGTEDTADVRLIPSATEVIF